MANIMKTIAVVGGIFDRGHCDICGMPMEGFDCAHCGGTTEVEEFKFDGRHLIVVQKRQSSMENVNAQDFENLRIFYFFRIMEEVVVLEDIDVFQQQNHQMHYKTSMEETLHDIFAEELQHWCKTHGMEFIDEMMEDDK